MIRLTEHAERELRRRAIVFEWIEAVVASPDRAEPDPRDPALTRLFKAIPDFGHRVLRVVYRPDGDDILVITAHFDRGASP
jgi:Domain of unknown function (DUF4258)